MKKTRTSLKQRAWNQMCTTLSRTQRKCTSSWRQKSAKIFATSRLFATKAIIGDCSRNRSMKVTFWSKCLTGMKISLWPTQRVSMWGRPLFQRWKMKRCQKPGTNSKRYSLKSSTTPSTRLGKKRLKKWRTIFNYLKDSNLKRERIWSKKKMLVS